MDALPNATPSSRSRTHHASGTQHLDDDINELPYELQPQFTEQDERRELATLTIPELTELQSDLTGIRAMTNGFSNLGLGGDTGELNVHGGEGPVSSGSSPPAPLPMSAHLRLAALDQHMMTLPAQSTAAYFMATAKCPDEVSNERKLIFLQCEENSIPLAAERLALYWQYRLDGFGEDRCFEPMTLEGAMRDEVVNMVKSGIFQLMPNTDASGRAIIYTRMDRRDFSQFSAKQEVAWLTYLLEIVVRHTSLQSRGFVCLFNASGGARKHYTRQSMQYLQRAIDFAFPIRMCSAHVCYTNLVVTHFLFPVVQRLKSKNVRLRSRLHRGSGEDLLRSLAEFNLPRDRLPFDMGGRVVLNIKQFVLDRLSLEASRAGMNLQPVEERCSPDDDEDGIVGKRQKVSDTNNEDQADRTGSTLPSKARHRNGRGQAPPIDGPSAGAAVAAAASLGTKASSKRKGPRNIVDPRMARAVRAKRDDPDLSLYAALISGGFVFTQKGSGTTDNDMFDENGVSLKQRKNNLCRRLRGGRGKDKKRDSKTGDDGTTSATQNNVSAAAIARRDGDKEAASILLHFKHTHSTCTGT